MIPIRIHLGLMVASEFLAFIVAAIVAVGLWVSGQLGQSLLLAAGLMFVSLLAATLVPRIFFRHILPARCPQENCNGSAFPTDTAPITYVCQLCEHRVETNVSENTQHGHFQKSDEPEPEDQ